MNKSSSPPTSAVAALSALAQLQQRPEWHSASPEQRVILQRIAAQRDQRLLARLERAQHRARLASSQQVNADAPLLERISVFARLHPAVTAAAATSLGLMVGPRRIGRLVQASLPTLLPLLAKMRR